MEIFTSDELLDVAQALQEGIPLPHPDIPTQNMLDEIGESLLSSLGNAKTEEEALSVVSFFIEKAICTGMMITSRRLVIDNILWGSKTLGMDC